MTYERSIEISVVLILGLLVAAIYTLAMVGLFALLGLQPNWGTVAAAFYLAYVIGRLRR